MKSDDIYSDTCSPPLIMFFAHSHFLLFQHGQNKLAE